MSFGGQRMWESLNLLGQTGEHDNWHFPGKEHGGVNCFCKSSHPNDNASRIRMILCKQQSNDGWGPRPASEGRRKQKTPQRQRRFSLRNTLQRRFHNSSGMWPA